MLILLSAFFLATRRSLGAMSTPLSAPLLIATATAILLWAGCVSAFANHSHDQKNDETIQIVNRALRWSPLLSLALVAFACSYPGARLIDWLVWLPAVTAACFGPPSPAVLRRPSPKTGSKPAPITSDESTELILQQITRTRLSDGRQAVHATLTADFSPLERNATLYVAFCPPFERLPEVDVDFDDANIATVKLTQVLHNGAQLDVVLARPTAANIAVSIELFASEPLID